MAEKPLVSVLMGVYQIEGLTFFSAAMESLLCQTYERIEILICNDGSTDKTAHILEEWAEQDPRIHILTHEKNRGLAAALNTCIDVAKGNYLARQDADDISHFIRLEEQVAFLERCPNVDFLGTNVNLCDRQGIWGERCLSEYPQKKDFIFCSPFVHGTVMYRAEALHKAKGYRVCRHTCRTEDYDLFMRMYAMGMKGANLQRSLYNYREDRENMEKRKYRYRVDEAIIRYVGFQKLELLPRYFPYVVKPLVVGLIPVQLLFLLKCKFHIFKNTAGESSMPRIKYRLKNVFFSLPNRSKIKLYHHLYQGRTPLFAGLWECFRRKCRPQNKDLQDIFVDYSEGQGVYTAERLLERLSDFDGVSFDMFDTLLFRQVKKPTEVFSLVEQSTGVSGFALNREQAERRAREERHRTTGDWEVSLCEIYAQMTVYSLEQRECLRRTEISTEYDQLAANPLMKWLVEGLNERNIALVVISDMYLDGNILTKLLEICGFPPFKRIYVSSEERVGKRDGKLFQRVKELEHWGSKRIAHIGDNFHSDVKATKEYGILGIHYIK